MPRNPVSKLLGSVMLIILTSGMAQAQQVDNERLFDLVQTQKYKEAAGYIKSVFPGEIKDSKIVSRLAYCNYMAGNLPEAEKYYKELLAKDSTFMPALKYLASIQEKRGNISHSSLYYLKMLRLDSTNFAIYRDLASNSARLYDTIATLKYLKKANALNPADPDVVYDYARLLLKKKDFKLTDSILKIAIKTDSLNILLINSRMELAHNLQDFKKAAEMAELSMRLGDKSLQTISVLGKSYYFLKKYEECIKIYSLLEGTAYGNESTFYYMGLAYRKLENMPKSNEYFQKSIVDGISFNIPIYYQELSINSESQKKFLASIAHLNKAETFADRNIFNYTRARIYDQELKQPKTALKFYKNYVKKYNEEVDKNKECYDYSLARIKELEIVKIK